MGKLFSSVVRKERKGRKWKQREKREGRKVSSGRTMPQAPVGSARSTPWDPASESLVGLSGAWHLCFSEVL